MSKTERHGAIQTHWLRYTALPIGLLVALLMCLLMLRAPAMATPLHMVNLAASVGLVLMAERRLPLRRDWGQVSRTERRIDATSMAVLMAFADPLVKFLILPMLALAALPKHLPHLAWFPADWPFLSQLALAAVIAEFGQYWVHRLAHRAGFFWGVHGFHHNAQRLYWLNGFRVNPLNMIWHQLSGLGVLVILGTPAETLQALLFVSTVFHVFQHANADLAYGGWNRVFGTADLHQWHHSAGNEIRHCNYGTVLMAWDQLFGTYYLGQHPPRQVGVGSGAPQARSYLAGLAEAMRNR